jgi:hypothetical protein
LANGAIKPVKIDHTKRLGLIRQPWSRSILLVDGVSLTPVNNPSNSIHSLYEFVIEFLSDFNNYDYDKLSEELSLLRKENGESFNDFEIRFIHIFTIFPLK